MNFSIPLSPIHSCNSRLNICSVSLPYSLSSDGCPVIDWWFACHVVYVLSASHQKSVLAVVQLLHPTYAAAPVEIGEAVYVASFPLLNCHFLCLHGLEVFYSSPFFRASFVEALEGFRLRQKLLNDSLRQGSRSDVSGLGILPSTSNFATTKPQRFDKWIHHSPIKVYEMDDYSSI